MGSFTNASSGRTYTLVGESIGTTYCTCQVVISDANGNVIETRSVNVPLAGGAITDNLGNTIAATVPTALANAITAFMSAMSAAVDAAAAAGKFNR